MESKRKRVLVIGAGGLGCAVLPLLVGSGAEILLLDDDVVSLSNLQRQLLFRTADVGRPKVEVAAERLRELSAGIAIEGRAERITPKNGVELVAGVDLVLDGSDNFPTRFLVNDACILAGTPLIHGGILRFTGQVMEIHPRQTACLRCLFEGPPPPGAVPSCAEAGVLGALCGMVGGTMGLAARRLLQGGSGEGDRLVVHDAFACSTRVVRLSRDAGCAACGDEPAIRSLDEARYLERSQAA